MRSSCGKRKAVMISQDGIESRRRRGWRERKSPLTCAESLHARGRKGLNIFPRHFHYFETRTMIISIAIDAGSEIEIQALTPFKIGLFLMSNVTKSGENTTVIPHAFLMARRVSITEFQFLRCIKEMIDSKY